jgi:hypothetical protein
MTGEIHAGTRHSPVEVSKQLTGQEQRKNKAVKASAWYHPFDRWDLLLFMMPVATIVFAMFWEAE